MKVRSKTSTTVTKVLVHFLGGGVGRPPSRPPQITPLMLYITKLAVLRGPISAQHSGLHYFALMQPRVGKIFFVSEFPSKGVYDEFYSFLRRIDTKRERWRH